MTSDGEPSRSPRASRWAGRSGLPDSSLASMSTIARLWDPPAARTASSAVRAEKVE
jgi:hypothetical protein